MIRVIHSLGGCGGTLLTRCLGVLSNVVILSEINPLSVDFFPELNPLYQDSRWLHLLSEGERERFSRLDLREGANFAAIIGALEKRAEAEGRVLILRDYNYADFIGVPFIAHPPMRRVLYDSLLDADATPRRAIGFVRHPVEQWQSLRKHPTVRRGALSPEEFASAYVAFAHDLETAPVFRYEDFLADPQNEMRRICTSLDLPFDPGFIDRFHCNDKATGDLGRRTDRTISAAARNPIPQQVTERFLACPGLNEAAAKLGYREVAPQEGFCPGSACLPTLVEGLRKQVEELRQGALEWMADVNAKEEEIRAVHAEAELRKVALERATSRIRELEASRYKPLIWKFRRFPSKSGAPQT